jgi:hypothetical protein
MNRILDVARFSVGEHGEGCKLIVTGEPSGAS